MNHHHERETASASDPSSAPQGASAPEFNAAVVEQGRNAKNINETFGGKVMHWMTYYGVGFVANGILSLGITYYLNPRKSVRDFKARATGFITRHPIKTEEDLKLLEQHPAMKKTLDSFRSAVEITFQFISGSIMTVFMMPLMKYKDNLAYKCNQLFGRDKEVVPECLQPEKTPTSQAEALEIELNKRVHRDRSNADLWKSRIILMFTILGGDFLYNRGNRKLEEHNLISGDTVTWAAGMKLNKILPKSVSDPWVNFFQNHGASVDLIRENVPDHFGRIERMERKYGSSPAGAPVEGLNTNSMVLGEQTRLITKEWGWTLFMASFLDKLTGRFQRNRIGREQEKAIASLRREGKLTDDFDVVATVDHKLHVTRKEPAEKSFAAAVGEKRSFTDRAAKSETPMTVGA